MVCSSPRSPRLQTGCVTPITGARPRLEEAHKVFRFMESMESILMRYEEDPRPIYMSDRGLPAKLFLPSGYFLRYCRAGRT